MMIKHGDQLLSFGVDGKTMAQYVFPDTIAINPEATKDDLEKCLTAAMRAIVREKFPYLFDAPTHYCT